MAYPRPLTEREQATLDFMLSPDDSRLEPLREQAKTARVTGMCTCGCATIDLAVDRQTSTRAPGLRSPAVDSYSRNRVDSVEARDLILFVDDGWLSSLEVVFYDGPPPAEFPDLELMEQPYATVHPTTT
jgi:hypothetical protein